MTLFFPNLTRPKKAAKHIAAILEVPLASSQQAIARTCGYQDWHDLERQVSMTPPSPLDQNLSQEQFVMRQAMMVSALASALSLPDGDVQHALADARLSGDRPVTLNEQIAIRIAIWRKGPLPVVSGRAPGAVGKLKSPGRNGEIVILLKYGRPTEVITHQGKAAVADYEYVSPKAAIGLFIPMRLYWPYGYWTETDGSHVIFSRDYNPMWRIRSNQVVERIEPWLRIKWIKQDFLWGDGHAPWQDASCKTEVETFFSNNNIHTLPMLADSLPLLIHGSSYRGEDCNELLKASRSCFA